MISRIVAWLWREAQARPRFKRLVVGWLLAIATTTVVVVEQREIGIARDEMVYVGSGSHYADWWLGKWQSLGNLSKADITRAFGGPGATDNNREHPPLMKTLFGFSERLLHDKLGIANELTAYRFPSAVLAGVLVLLVFMLVLEVWGFGAATLAALLTMLLPRALFHAGLAAFDAPMTTLWFATVYAYWRSLDIRPGRRRRWPWQVGVMFGLALATKHNAILLPFALVPHLILVAWRTRGHGLDRVRVLLSLLVLGPLVLVAVWPWLWFDTLSHVRDWLGFHMTHVHYNFEYLGHNWNAPRFPWHVALVTTLFTVPVATLAAAAFGVVAVIRERAIGTDHQRAPAILLFLSAGVSIGPFVLGSTPIFGAEKHWAPAIPAFCIAAGIGAVWVARLAAEYVTSRWPTRRQVPALALGAVGLALVGAATAETLAAQPHALTWYNAAAGGAPGGADLGMNRQFWGVAARGVLPELAKAAPRNPKPSVPVYSHDASPAWGMYAKLGLLPPGLPDAGMEEAGIARSKLAIVIHERHFNRHDYLIWKSYGTLQPSFVLRVAGVPIVSVYTRPSAK